MNKIPCRCGHLEKMHPARYLNTYVVCDGCFRKNRVSGIKQFGSVECMQYISDNLLYVEQEAKRKGLV